MVEALDPDDESIEVDCSQVPRYDPPDWISTDQLDSELWNAIMEDTPGCSEEDLDNCDDRFEGLLDAEDDEEDEEEHRRSTFTLLVGMRPFLGEILAGPPATEQTSDSSSRTRVSTGLTSADAKPEKETKA